jgi:hypothetical protein
MPMPAVPAPKTTMRWSRAAIPVTSTAARIAASTTAAVPWMSSLKVQMGRPILRQDAVRVAGPEVLPVQHRLGNSSGDRLDEQVDELVVTLAAHPGVPLAEVEVAVEQTEVVGADVQDDRV